MAYLSRPGSHAGRVSHDNIKGNVTPMELVSYTPEHEREPSPVDVMSLGYGKPYQLLFPIGMGREQVNEIIYRMSQVFYGTYTIVRRDDDPTIYTELIARRNAKRMTIHFTPDKPEIMTISSIVAALPYIIELAVSADTHTT